MLRCLSPYRAAYREGFVTFAPGEEITDPSLEAHLLSDSPASFEVVVASAPAAPTPVKAVEPDQVVTKPIRSSNRKGASDGQ